MVCSTCGSDIPYTGKICPYCHSDKSSDKAEARKFNWILFLVGLPSGIVCALLWKYFFESVSTGRCMSCDAQRFLVRSVIFFVGWFGVTIIVSRLTSK